MFVHYILLVQSGLLSGHLLGNSNLFSLYFVCLWCLFISRFGFKSGICPLNAPVPVHCFSITFIASHFSKTKKVGYSNLNQIRLRFKILLLSPRDTLSFLVIFLLLSPRYSAKFQKFIGFSTLLLLSQGNLAGSEFSTLLLLSKGNHAVKKVLLKFIKFNFFFPLT